MNNDWFHEYFINELKAIGRKNASKLSYEVVDSLPPSGEENIIYFVKSDSGSSNNHYDEYAWISSSSAFEKIGSTQIDGSTTQPDWNQNDATQPDYVKNRPFYTGDPVETVLVEESTVMFKENGGLYAGLLESTVETTAGETYKVSWDGTVYECPYATVNGLSAIGNLAILDMGPDTGEPFMIGVEDGHGIFIYTTDTSASHTISISGITIPVVKIDPKYLPIPFKPDGKSYLTFSSSSSFTLKVNDATKHWDGTLEYFTSDRTWTVWDGTSALSAVADDGEYFLYLRGTGNTVITGNNLNCKWVLSGADVKCIGNIENLLNYATVESGAHPDMASNCYYNMFNSCTSLTQAPSLPATALSTGCYSGMFYGCTSLTQAPVLPATTVASNCYSTMFHSCTSLTQAPTLPATKLANFCYSDMFHSCTSLTQAPALPATTLASGCYSGMFNSCTSLTQVPALPATTLASACYASMFQGCTSLKLSSTKTDKHTQEYRIPTSGNGTTAANALSIMFTSTGGTFTDTPEINTTYYLSSDNMVVRETELATLNGYVGSMINTALSAIGIAEEGTY